jgi:hypothetical protein
MTVIIKVLHEAPHYEPNGRPTFHAARWRSRETTLAALFALSATTSCRYGGYSDALNFQTFFFYLFIYLEIGALVGIKTGLLLDLYACERSAT